MPLRKQRQNNPNPELSKFSSLELLIELEKRGLGIVWRVYKNGVAQLEEIKVENGKAHRRAV